MADRKLPSIATDITQYLDKEYVVGKNTMLDFAQLYLASIQLPKDYGSGEKLYTIEAHILSYIASHPGATITELALHWNRAKATVSESVSKLEKRGFLMKTRDPENQRICHLSLTDKGQEFNGYHHRYDAKVAQEMEDFLLQRYTISDLETFYLVLDGMIEFYRRPPS